MPIKHSILRTKVLRSFSSSTSGATALLVVAVTAMFVFTRPAAAQLAAKPAAEWIKTLDSSNRVAELKIDQTIAGLRIKPGDVVADIGAGSGLFSLPLARAVGTNGEVYAVDIDRGLLDHIASKAHDEGITNIKTILGKLSDPDLPGAKVNLALISDVLHHIENRAAYLKNLARYMESSGRIAIIDFKPELGPHKNDPALQVTRAQADAWMTAAGFDRAEEVHLFQDKWFVIYSR